MMKVNNVLFFTYPSSGNLIVYNYLRRREDLFFFFYLSSVTEAHISATINVIILIPC